MHFTLDIGPATLAGMHSGSGTPIIFLHAGIADHRMWAPQLTAFAKTHHVIAYDRRGFGGTISPDVAFAHVDDLLAIMDHFGLAAATLVGCSQGGRIAIDCALAHPQRVHALMLIAAAISGASEPGAEAAEIQAVIDALEIAEEANDLARVNQLECQLWLDGPSSPPGRAPDTLRELFLDMNGIALRKPALARRIQPASAFDRVHDIHAPTCVCWGDLDFAHVQANGRYLATRIVGAQSGVITGTAHLPNLEQPAAVNAMLWQLLCR